MAKKVAVKKPKSKSKATPSVARRVESLESRMEQIELWAGNLFNPDTAPKSFERRKVAR